MTTAIKKPSLGPLDTICRSSPGNFLDSQLGGASCESLNQGFDDGILTCAADCMSFETSSCKTTCGNQIIGGAEQCDGISLADQSCAAQGFVIGALGCNDDCTFDTSACLNEFCGDGAANGGEPCDGSDLTGQSCTDHGFLGGTLRCYAGCDDFDTSDCTSCGDNIINGEEACDGGSGSTTTAARPRSFYPRMVQ